MVQFELEEFHMEPMVIVALGFVIYSIFLTSKDLLSDFRMEGLLRKSASGRAPAEGSASEETRFMKSGKQPEPAMRTRKSSVQVPCRQLTYSRERLAVENRPYPLRQR
jgi:hypothetical protein